MKLVHWEFESLSIPMVETEDGVLLCTIATLAKALHTETDSISTTMSRRPEDFDNVRPTDSRCKEFLSAHRAELGLQRIGRTLRLLTETDVIILTLLSRGDQGKAFRKQFINFIKANAKRHVVTREEYDALLAQVSSMAAVVQQALPAIDGAASAAGKALEAQKRVRLLHLVN